MTLPAVEIRVSALAQEPLSLAEVAGSAVRGALGESLRAVSCRTREPTCEGCGSLDACSFPFLYATPSTAAESTYAREQDAPRRYVVRWEPGAGQVAAGRSLRFGLRIVGDAGVHLPWLGCALVEMGRRGMGKGRGCFEITRADVVGANEKSAELVVGGVVRSTGAADVEPLDLAKGLSAAATATERAHNVAIVIDTPLYLRAHGHDPFAPPPFEVLLRAALRRISSLVELYGSGACHLPYDDLIARTRAVVISRAEVRAMRARRFSSRQVKFLPLEGITGWIRYEGVPTDAAEVVRAAAWMGIGKMATHGLGQIRVERVE